jgi:maltose operon protein
VNKQTSVFAPNVLILDQNMTPSAFFPSDTLPTGAWRDERRPPGRKMRLTPALGQQKIYVLVFTTEKDLQQTTSLSIRRKPMPKAQVTRYRISGPVSATSPMAC